MSQDIWSSINPDTTSGTMLATILTAFKNAITSKFSGTSRPANLLAGGMWIDTTNEATANGSEWSFKVYTGSVDIEVFRLSVSTNGQYGGTIWGDSEFDVQHIAADAVQAYVEFIKQRLINNGQILANDTVMQIKWIGTNNLGTQPTVAYLSWTAIDNETTSAYGGTLSFANTPAGTSAITEHFRFISGVIETVKPHKMNSQRLVSQNIATAATIAALDTTCRVVEMTGSTATSIQGMDATGKSQVVTIHNRSTANVTISHQDAGATATNRFKLPKSLSLTIIPQGSATFYYCTTDSVWKALGIPGLAAKKTRTIDTVQGITSTWACPSTTTEVTITAYPRCSSLRAGNGNASVASSSFIGPNGELYAWGYNANGSIGDGTLVAKSSPVAVLGSTRFIPSAGLDGGSEQSPSSIELDNTGKAWAWGANTNGQLGNGNVAVQSSPVAVLGSLVFSSLYRSANFGNSQTAYGLTPNGTLYGWGSSGFNNGSGWPNLGVGAVSSPVAVIGGLKFSRLYTNGLQHVALQTDGTPYTWGSATIGSNGGGPLGVGDLLGRSSPVAVLGGLKFSKVGLVGPSPSGFVGLTTAGAAYVWGAAVWGATGFAGNSTLSSPVAVLGGLTFADIFTITGNGSFQVWALQSDGTPYAWGVNNSSNGYLGIGTNSAASSPVAVLGGFKFKKIVPFPGGAFGIQSDGTTYAWGINGQGQLGVGDTLARSSPVAVLGGLSAVTHNERATQITLQVTAGSNYTVNLGHAGCTFGGILIGEDIDSIAVEYEK